MRGIHPLEWGFLVLPRFIPADAGNTWLAAQLTQKRIGSSPRMRGILKRRNIPCSSMRFIPADAGNTVPAKHALSPLAVHPRGCGEYAFPPLALVWPAGSSPRMRGIRRPLPPSQGVKPVHPRGCGEYTSARRWCLCRAAVHPRGCGEYEEANASAPTIPGSSPRMRGIRVAEMLLQCRQRFIPADAGNTFAGCWPCGRLPVHPRGCGEYLDAIYGLW